MTVASKAIDPRRRRQLGLRVNREIHQALKISAAIAGETMEDTLHRILARELHDHLPGEARQDHTTTVS